MKPSAMTTAEIVAYFKAGLTMREVSAKFGMDLRIIEKAIRRWLVLYPEGRKG